MISDRGVGGHRSYDQAPAGLQEQRFIVSLTVAALKGSFDEAALSKAGVEAAVRVEAGQFERLAVAADPDHDYLAVGLDVRPDAAQRAERRTEIGRGDTAGSEGAVEGAAGVVARHGKAGGELREDDLAVVGRPCLGIESGHRGIIQFSGVEHRPEHLAAGAKASIQATVRVVANQACLTAVIGRRAHPFPPGGDNLAVGLNERRISLV